MHVQRFRRWPVMQLLLNSRNYTHTHTQTNTHPYPQPPAVVQLGQIRERDVWRWDDELSDLCVWQGVCVLQGTTTAGLRLRFRVRFRGLDMWWLKLSLGDEPLGNEFSQVWCTCLSVSSHTDTYMQSLSVITISCFVAAIIRTLIQSHVLQHCLQQWKTSVSLYGVYLYFSQVIIACGVFTFK